MTRRFRSSAVINRLRRRDQHDSGLASIELVILLPAFALLVLLAVYLGRTNVAQSSLDSAAQDAARAASLQRNKDAALTAALTAAKATLDPDPTRNAPTPCVPGTVTATITNATTTDPFQTRLGTPSRVDIKVTCTVFLSNLVFPGLPIHGDVTKESTFSSPIDDYRVRIAPSAPTP
jgi:Flp pilus assembly protein TadG